jgi:predicted nucleic acid-binding protein
VIFVDTSFFAALLLPKDANHRRAAEAVEGLGQVRLSEVLLTTNNVVLETISLSFVVMLAHGITEAFAFDDDFSHRFVVRPGSR